MTRRMSCAVDEDGPGAHFVKAGQQVKQGGFARARRTHQGHHFAPAHGEVDVLEHLAAVGIGKSHPPVDDLGFEGRQIQGAGGVLNFRLPVHEPEDPHRRGQALLDGVLHPAQALDGLVEHQERRQEGEKGPRGGGPPDDRVAAVKDDARHAEGTQELHHRRGDLPGGVEPHAGAEIVPVGLKEALLLVILPGEGLDDALADEAFLEHGVKVGVGHLGLVRDATDAPAQVDDEEHRQGEDRHGQQGQAPLPVEDDRGQAEDREGVLEKAGDGPGHRVLQQVDIVSEAAHQDPGGLAVEESQGLALQRPEELVPEARDDAVADVAHLVVVGVGQRPFDQVEQHHQRGQEIEHVLFFAEKDVVQDRLYQVGQQGGEGRDPQHGQDGSGHAQLMGLEIGQQPQI